MTHSTHGLVPQYIHEIAPYVPGKPIEEVERELKMHAIKLASNENPLGPSPLAVEAARKALASSNRYPDGSGFYLRQALAKKHDIPMENIILGGGSTELIGGPGSSGVPAPPSAFSASSASFSSSAETSRN